MDRLSDHSFCDQPAQHSGHRIEIIGVSDRQLARVLFNVRNDLCRFLIIECERLFHYQQMTPGIDGLRSQSK